MKKGDKAQSLSPFFRFWPQLLRKQCDRVKYLPIFPSFLQSRRDMQRAADIRGGHSVASIASNTGSNSAFAILGCFKT
jgi:hypothetical protein